MVDLLNKGFAVKEPDEHQGKSLNSELLQGLDLTNTLCGVLTRFSYEHVALKSDIEAKYHQVKVPQEDIDILHFLWWPN